MTATSLRIEHFSVFTAQSQWSRQRAKICQFAAQSQWNRQPAEICQFAAQSLWSRIAVSVGSQCIRHQIDGDCAAN